MFAGDPSGLGGNRLADLLRPFVESEADPWTHIYGVSGRQAVHRALYGSEAKVGPQTDYYLCNVDYTRHLGISVHDPEDAGARPVRDRLLFPEGPVVWNRPRPDSSANLFCLSCHDNSEKGGLTVDVLKVDTSCAVSDPSCSAEHDLRRQPTQPPAMMLGHVPANYFGTGKPALSGQDLATDRWILEGPVYHWTFDEGGGSKIGNQAQGNPGVSSGAGALEGATFSSEPGRRGSFLEFDAGQAEAFDSVDHVKFDSFDIEGPGISLSAWFRLGIDRLENHSAIDVCRLSSFLGDRPCTLISKAGADGSAKSVDWALAVGNASSRSAWRVRFSLKVGNNLKTLTAEAASLVAGEWHHLAAGYDGEQMVLYLDGVEIGAKPASGDISTHPHHPVTVGSRRSKSGPLQPFFGGLDDIRVYNRALLPWEVAEISKEFSLTEPLEE